MATTPPIGTPPPSTGLADGHRCPVKTNAEYTETGGNFDDRTGNYRNGHWRWYLEIPTGQYVYIICPVRPPNPAAPTLSTL